MSLNRTTLNNNETESNRVNVGEEDEFELEGLVTSIIRSVILAILVILSGGTFLIVLSWRPSLKARLSSKRCCLEQARTLLIRDIHGREFVEKVISSTRDSSFNYKYFCHKKLKYIWNSEYKHFVKLKGLESEKCNVIYSQVEGASSTEASIKLDLYGRNSIDIEVLPIWKLVLDEITGPFYIYQFFICSIWLIQLYYQFAACILLLSILSVATHVWQTRKQTIALRKKVNSASIVTVIRDSIPKQKSSIELVPGDVIVMPKHSSFMMECDAVLMTGSCIVDESMLTGESVPVPKVPLVENSNSTYSSSVHKSSTLFSGTKVLNVQSAKEHSEVKAVVVRTGFSTAKGELARSILFPSHANDNLKKQLIKMSIIFFFIGIPCMIYTVYALSRFDFSVQDICIIVLDVATFLIPPVLPAVLTSLNVHAQRRLKTKGIYCLNPRMITCSGEIDVMCFDKTGTLTEDTIDFAGAVQVNNEKNKFQPLNIDICSLASNDMIVKCMATCHSLVEYNGNVEGDELEVKLFRSSGWKFEDNLEAKQNLKNAERIVSHSSTNNHVHILGILKQFPFESFLQRMLVIVKDTSDENILAIVKGAPEMIASFCSPDSVPSNFLQTFEYYTSKGFRVLATASKILANEDETTPLNMSRNEIECNMTFNGLYLFKNKLKDSTYGVLQELSKADIRCVMATGDNILTAISVAEECNLVKKSDAIIKVNAFTDKSNSQLRVSYSYVKLPKLQMSISDTNGDSAELGNGFESSNMNYHLAIDGDSYNIIKMTDLKLLNKIVHKGTIFARMSPDQKLSLITLLKKQNHSVGMCGDGANDCGALRAADSGIALSVAEASVASPFTYKYKDISCVPSLIKEGRCTLVAVFGAFKYQVCYCFILLGAVLILFWHGTKPSDGTYVFIDIVLNILPPILFGTTKPYKSLVKRMPTRNMLSFVPQASMYSFILVQVFFYYLASVLLTKQIWYQPVSVNLANIHDPLPCQLSYAVFSLNMMSYVIAAIIFAPGPPYRSDFFSNKKYILMVMINFVLAGTITVIAPQFMLDYLKFVNIPYEFRLKLMALTLFNFVFCFIWERYILQELVLKYVIPTLKTRLNIQSKKKFKTIDKQLKVENWPFTNLVYNTNMNQVNFAKSQCENEKPNLNHSQSEIIS